MSGFGNLRDHVILAMTLVVRSNASALQPNTLMPLVECGCGLVSEGVLLVLRRLDAGGSPAAKPSSASASASSARGASSTGGSSGATAYLDAVDPATFLVSSVRKLPSPWTCFCPVRHDGETCVAFVADEQSPLLEVAKFDDSLTPVVVMPHQSDRIKSLCDVGRSCVAAATTSATSGGGVSIFHIPSKMRVVTVALHKCFGVVPVSGASSSSAAEAAARLMSSAGGASSRGGQPLQLHRHSYPVAAATSLPSVPPVFIDPAAADAVTFKPDGMGCPHRSLTGIFTTARGSVCTLYPEGLEMWHPIHGLEYELSAPSGHRFDRISLCSRLRSSADGTCDEFAICQPTKGTQDDDLTGYIGPTSVGGMVDLHIYRVKRGSIEYVRSLDARAWFVGGRIGDIQWKH